MSATIACLVLAQDAARQIVVQGPPWWTQVLSPAASLLGIAAAYFLGRHQGKAQIRHERGVEVLAEVLRLALEASEIIKDWTVWVPVDGIDRKDLNDPAYALSSYYKANAPWLAPETLKKIETLADGLSGVASDITVLKNAEGSAQRESMRKPKRKLRR